MTNEEFEQILSYRHETRGVEFKGPGPRTDGRLFAQVSKAVLGMSNRRNGGAVIVGVADSDQFPNLVGLSETELVLSQPRNRKGLEAKGRTDGLGPSLRKSVWVIVIWRLTEY